MTHHTPNTDSETKEAVLIETETERIGVGVFTWLQAILIAVVPLLVAKKFFFPFIVPRTSFFMIMVLLLVVNWAVLHYVNPERFRLPWKNPIIIGAGVMLGVWTVSGLLGASWTLSFWSTYQRMTGVMLLLHLFVWLLVSVSVLRTEKIWDRMIGLLAGTGALVSLYTILGPQGFGLLNGLDVSRGGATIGNTSFLGAYVLFALFAAILLLVKHYRATRQWLTWRALCILFMVASPAIFNYKLFLGQLGWGEAFADPTLFIGQARAVTASIVLGLLVAAGLYLLRQKRVWQKVLGGVLSLGPMLGSAVGLVLLFQPGSWLYESFGRMASRSRFTVWAEAASVIRERPLLGWGPESFDLLHQKAFNPLLYYPEFGGELWFDRAHNIVIDTMLSTGLLGVLAYMGVFAGLFYVVYKLRSAGRMTNAESALLGGLMFAYILQNMTVFDMTVSYVAFFLILAYVAAKLPRSAYRGVKESLSSGLNQALHGGIALVAIVLIFAWPVRILNSAWSISSSIRGGSVAERMELYEDAFNLPMSRTLWLRTVATQMYEAIRARPDLLNPASRDGIQAEAEFFETALAYEAETRPYNYRAYITAAKMAQLQAYAGKPQKIEAAREYALAAVAIAPQNPMAYITLYELSAMQGDWDQAEMYLSTMLAAAPGSEFIQKSHEAAQEAITQLRAGETPDPQPTIRF